MREGDEEISWWGMVVAIAKRQKEAFGGEEHIILFVMTVSECVCVCVCVCARVSEY